MKRNLQGHYITISTLGEKVQAFIPAPLPPTPPIEWSSELREKFDLALSFGKINVYEQNIKNSSPYPMTKPETSIIIVSTGGYYIQKSGRQDTFRPGSYHRFIAHVLPQSRERERPGASNCTDTTEHQSGNGR